MKKLLWAMAMALSLLAVPARAADVVTAISLAELNQKLNSGGIASQVETAGGIPILRINLGASGYVHVAAPGCAADANAPCSVLEFLAVLNTPAGVSDAAIAAIDKEFELASIDRTDAGHVAVTDGMVLMGGVTLENIAANIGFFVGQCGEVEKALASTGRTT